MKNSDMYHNSWYTVKNEHTSYLTIHKNIQTFLEIFLYMYTIDHKKIRTLYNFNL